MISQPEILFVYLDCTTYIYRGATYHLGSGYVRAYLKECGVHTRQLVADSRVRLTDIADMIIREQPRAVGFTCYDSNYYTSKLIARLLKKRSPEIITLMGGPAATFSDKLIMRDTQAVDACIRGEGEYSTAEIVERLRQGTDLTGIQGVTHRRGDKIVREADRPRGCAPTKGAELDIFASPYSGGVFPLDEMALGGLGEVGISTSRGCPYSCVYCNFATMSGHRLRYHSVDRVIADLSKIDTAAGKRLALGEKLRVAIQDDAFSMDVERAKAICRRIIEQGFKHIVLQCETRADHVDRELFELLQQAGFGYINFGLESAVPRILRIIKKVSLLPAADEDFAAEKKFLKQIKQAVNWCREVGIDPSVSIISGLPSETLEEGLATLEFVKTLGVSKYLHNHLLLHAGTEAFEKQADFGIIATPSARCLPYYTKRHYNTRRIPVLDSRKLTDMGNVIQAWLYFFHVKRLMVAPFCDADSTARDILFQDAAEISPEFFHWLNDFIPPSAMLSTMNKDRQGFNWKKSVANTVKAHTPLLGIPSLVPGDRSTVDVPEYVWSKGILPEAPYYQSHMHRFYFMPFGKLAGLAAYRENYQKRVMFLTLETEGDRSELLAVSERLAKQGLAVLPRELTGFHCYFLNECGWQPDQCAAGGLSRLIANAEGEIKTCLNGGVIGRVGDKAEELKRTLHLLKAAKIKQRGCVQCRVNDQCSKCLFPAMSDAEYCRLKREHPAITALVKLMPYVRSAWLYNTLHPAVYSALFGRLEFEEKRKLEYLSGILGLRAEQSAAQEAYAKFQLN